MSENENKKEIRCVEDLEVYKKAHNLTLRLYKITQHFLSEEKFGLVPQIRRAASSINANLLEGSYRLNRREFRQFVGIARGSAGELKYHLLLSKDLKYISDKSFKEIYQELEIITKMLFGLANSLLETKS